MNEIRLYGTVGVDFWDEPHFTPAQVADQMAALEPGPITVRINSGGGIATDGQAIYSLLRSSGRQITVVVDGIAASAASLIAMAGDTILMPLGSQLMIHDPAQWMTSGRGTEEDHLRTAKGLRVTANAYAGVYAARAGITTEAAREIMMAETWYDGPGAVAAGFATDTDQEAAAAAAVFDYRLYAHAPENLRQRALPRAAGLSRAAVMATMMGTPAPSTPKGQIMKEEDEEMTLATAEEEQIEAAAAEDEEEPEAQVAEDDDTEDEEMKATAAVQAAPVAVQILDLMTALGRPASEARDYISRNMTLEQVTTDITAKLQQETPTMAGPNRTPARIMRDERDTRRAGMTAALAHQIGRVGEVDGNARRFMDMSLIDMAAACANHKGPVRFSGDKIEVFMAASHTSSDFPAIFENAMNKILLDRYEAAVPTYRAVARQRNFRDFLATPLIRTGDFPTLKKVPESGEIEFGTVGESKETAVLVPYAKGIAISRQMIINDDLGAIDEILTSYGEMVPAFEETAFYAFALTATLASGRTVFHADHNNLASSGGAITVDTLSAGRAAIMKQKSIDGRNLNLRPTILLVGPDNLTAAEQIVADTQPVEAGKVNPFSGRLTPVSTPEITGNEWYLLCGPERSGSPWVYGYLEGAEGPRLRTQEPFGTQGFRATIEHDFGMGAQDYRGGWKNPGA